MCEVHKPDQWPEVVQDAIKSGGKICRFQDVPERAECLVQIGAHWMKGIKLPELQDGLNFVHTAKGRWHERLYAFAPYIIVVFIPEAELAEETINTTFSEITREETFRYNDHLCMVSWEEDGNFAAVIIRGALRGLRLHPVADSVIQKIVRKGKVSKTDTSAPDSAGPGAPDGGA